MDNVTRCLNKIVTNSATQCSMTFCGSGSADPNHWLTDPDPRIRTTDLRIRILLFPQWLTRCQQKRICVLIFCILTTFWRCIYISLQRWKVKKSPQNGRNQWTKNDGSGSGKSKNIRFLRIQIHNTAARYEFSFWAKSLNSVGWNYPDPWEDTQSVN